MTNKERITFEQQKQEIIEELNRIDPEQMYVEYVIHKIRQLKLDYPTCITCTNCRESIDPETGELDDLFECRRDDFTEPCIDLMSKKEIQTFGCIHYSELEGKNEIS